MVVDDPDLWGHLLYGLEHFRSGHLTRTDPYSYTAPGAAWTNHEWLCEWLFAWAWTAFGAVGLWGWRVLLVGVTLGVVLMQITRSTRGLWVGLIVYFICWYEMSRGFAIRPQLFTYACFTVLLLLIERTYQSDRWPVATRFLFLPLMCLWANVHGGFVVGLCVLATFLGCEAVKALRGDLSLRKWAGTGMIVLLAGLITLLNPYGIGLWDWLYRSLSVPRAALIEEWAPIVAFKPQYTVLGFYILIVLSLVALAFTRRRRELFEFVLLLALAAAAFRQNRHSVFFAIAAAVYLPKYIESMIPRLARPRNYSKAFVGVTVGICASYAIGSHFCEGHRPDAILVETRDHPRDAYTFIRDNELSGNVLVAFNWAQSCLWHLHDSCKVAFDGRFRTVYPKAVEDAFVRFYGGESGWDDLLEDDETEMVLMPRAWPGTRILLDHEEWRLAYERGGPTGDTRADDCVLLIRRGSFPEFEARLIGGDVRQPEIGSRFRFGLR